MNLWASLKLKVWSIIRTLSVVGIHISIKAVSGVGVAALAIGDIPLSIELLSKELQLIRAVSLALKGFL